MEAVATILEVEVVAVQELAVALTQALEVPPDLDQEVAQDTVAVEVVLDQAAVEVAQDTAVVVQDLEVVQDPIVVEVAQDQMIHQAQLSPKKKQKV